MANEHDPSSEERSANDPGYFRYTDRPDQAPQLIPITSGEKYQRAKSIYDRLVQAKGDFRYPIPDFMMSRNERMVAWMNYDALLVGLEEKAYDVCLQFGDQADAAIATLLGHELTHYYEKHAWRRGFAANFQDLEIGVKLDKIRDNVLNETQADYLGGFLAYSAGFSVFDKTPDFMAAVYKAYGLPDELANYPSLSDRKTLAQRSGERMKELITIQNMANWMNAVASFDEAKLYYYYILREYQSRELYNNLGVLLVREALQQFTSEEVKFLFPLELDLAADRGGSRDLLSDRKALLQEAVLNFDYAISLDPDYAPAYLNKACAYTLLGDVARAKFYAETEAYHRAIAADQPKVVGDTEILLGIIAYRQKHENLTRDYFNKAIAKNNSLAAVNLKILTGELPAPPSHESFFGESIDGIDLLSDDYQPGFEEDLTLYLTNEVRLLQSPEANSHIYIHHNRVQQYIFCIQVTGPDYPGTTAKQIKIGDSTEKVIEQYGTPLRRLGSPQGDILVYNNLFFVVDAEHGLGRWGTYMNRRLG